MKKGLFIALMLFSLCGIISINCSCFRHSRETKKVGYKVVNCYTPNYTEGRTNSVEGVILHHAASSSLESAIGGFTTLGGLSAHCLIDYDGTRYIFCRPEVVAWHAGKSILNGRKSCNFFTIGIEFWGDTNREPLTEDQIKSAIEYLKPIITQYHIPLANIATHKMVRDAYKKKYPKDDVPTKSDITDVEYKRFMRELEKAMDADPE